MLGDDGEYYKLSIANISQQIRLQQHYALTTRILEEMHEGVMLADAQHRITYVNRAFSEVTGYTPEEVYGQSPSILSSGKHDQHFYAAMWARLYQAGLWRGEIWNKRKNGEVYVEWLTISRMMDETSGNEFYLAVFSDISDRKYSELKLLQMAQYDSIMICVNCFIKPVSSATGINAAGDKLLPCSSGIRTKASKPAKRPSKA